MAQETYISSTVGALEFCLSSPAEEASGSHTMRTRRARGSPLPGALFQPRRSVWGGPQGGWPANSLNITLREGSGSLSKGDWDHSGATCIISCSIPSALCTLALSLGCGSRADSMICTLTQKGPIPSLLCYLWGSMRSLDR